jgi:hypothetical protein
MALDTFQLGGHSTSLSPAEIERELSSLWKPQSDGPTPDSTSVSRIVLGNVIWIGTADQADRTRAVILKVLPKYPCRLFLLEYQPRQQRRGSPRHRQRAVLRAEEGRTARLL